EVVVVAESQRTVSADSRLKDAPAGLVQSGLVKQTSLAMATRGVNWDGLVQKAVLQGEPDAHVIQVRTPPGQSAPRPPADDDDDGPPGVTRPLPTQPAPGNGGTRTPPGT